MSKLWRLAFLIVAVPSTEFAMAASGSHSLSDIATTAAMEMQQRASSQGYNNVDVEVRPLDSRLQLAACDRPLQTLPDTSGRPLGPVSVGIRCEGAQAWTLYVRGQVTAMVELPVLAGSVGRGDMISKTDVMLQSRRISADPAGIVTEINDVIGKEARRTLTAGSELRFSDLKAPVLVDRGQEVSIVSGVAGLRVSMQGKALNAGGVGDRVLVANLKTGKRLEGVVSSNGSVLVN